MDEFGTCIFVDRRSDVTGNECERCNETKRCTQGAGGIFFRYGNDSKLKDPYTSADLNYNNANCRANLEQQDETARPEIKGKVKNIRNYDVIFLGYPKME